MDREQMRAKSKARSYEAWQTRGARKLLDAYYACKEAIRLPSTMYEWGGMLLVVHGALAVKALDGATEMGARIPKAKRLRRVLEQTINDELGRKHGVATCHACGKTGKPTLDWRCKSRFDEDDRLLDGLDWACPSCAVSLEGEPV